MLAGSQEVRKNADCPDKVAPEGLEPSRPFGQTVLSRSRMPIPPQGLSYVFDSLETISLRW